MTASYIYLQVKAQVQLKQPSSNSGVVGSTSQLVQLEVLAFFFFNLLIAFQQILNISNNIDCVPFLGIKTKVQCEVICLVSNQPRMIK